MSGLEDNSAFYPGPGARAASPFAGHLDISQSLMSFEPVLRVSKVGGRDARLFPAARLAFVSMDDVLVPVQCGEITGEDLTARTSSYWSLIPQFGRVWRDPSDPSGWSRGAFPLMLVNDLENHAHQGLARFRYGDSRVEDFQFQFVQQTSPYLLGQHFVAWGGARVRTAALPESIQERARTHGRRVLAARLPAQPWKNLIQGADWVDWSRFGQPLDPQWTVSLALVKPPELRLGSNPAAGDEAGRPIVYFQESASPRGPYPYPQDMRFGVRSVMKSIAAPLSLLRLAQSFGPRVLNLYIGEHVAGLNPKFHQVRFIDAANMASGFGGTGTLQTRPNDFEDGSADADYDGWYTAPSHAEKLAHIQKWLQPYPWPPGTVLRYRDQDFYLLGAALNHFLKSVRGDQADIWDLLCEEVFAPIGIYAAPTTRTREAPGQPAVPWFNAGYFPTVDDLAKIALLYQGSGQWNGEQILHRELTAELLAGKGAISKQDGSVLSGTDADRLTSGNEVPVKPTHYRMGFHFTPYCSRRSGKLHFLPTMWGAGESEVILYPNGLVSIRIGKAAGVPGRVWSRNRIGRETIETVESLASWE